MINDVIPISIVSFNRPDYLERLLISLKAQTDTGNVEYHLFQDNAINKFSGKQYAKLEEINQCCMVFNKYFPEGEIHLSPFNIGIALNYDNTFRHIFEDKKHNYGIFLEDDVVLNSYYIYTLRLLLTQYNDNPLVGMVSAKGRNPLTTLEEQEENKHKLSPFGSFLAIGIQRERWLDVRPFFDKYLEIVGIRDYRCRPRDELIELYESKGVYCTPQNLVSSQDRAREIGMLSANQIFLSTVTNNLTYIGERGVHTNSGVFRKQGFDRQIIFNKKVDYFEPLDNEQLMDIIREWRGRHGMNK